MTSFLFLFQRGGVFEKTLFDLVLYIRKFFEPPRVHLLEKLNPISTNFVDAT